MFVLLLLRADDGLPTGAPTLRGKIPPPRGRKAARALRTDRLPEPRAMPSSPRPSFQFSWKYPRCSAIVPVWEPQMFPPAAIPFRHPRAFLLPVPDAPNAPAAPVAFPRKKPQIAFPDRTSATRP